ncbi:hypothetical protein ISN44_As03g042180 [Arabidopsis suecica]|uniref:Uncharacterized protein n=1 Tax=Arabidopsis suecica TaxID=45249 RepID=A0A8T2FCD8_ARASU|nr:hypothetical protein ISN44_As03g042180 [Arabidopsis suecica]
MNNELSWSKQIKMKNKFVQVRKNVALKVFKSVTVYILLKICFDFV